MIEPHDNPGTTRQCAWLGLSRSGYYYQPRSLHAEALVLLRRMDEQYLNTPQYGARSYATWFKRQGLRCGPEQGSGHDGDCGH